MQFSQDIPSYNETRSLAFVMEQQVGLRTNYLNWRTVVGEHPEITPSWTPITYYEEHGLIEKLTFLPESIRSAARCHLQVRRGLSNRAFDAVLFNTYFPAVMHASTLYRQPTFIMYDVTPVDYDRMSSWYGHSVDTGAIAEFKKQRVTEVLNAANGLFACSRWAARTTAEVYRVPTDRIYILPFSVDTGIWKPTEQHSASSEAGKTRILFVGGDFNRKGGDLLVRWAAENGATDCEVHIVTARPIKAPPNVTVYTNMKSNSPELIALAQTCTLFVLPTRADCYSIASLEAMAVGLPVITCSVGGIPDIIRDGENGYLIPPDDYDALADRLDFLILRPDLQKQLGRQARSDAVGRFDSHYLVNLGLRIMDADSDAEAMLRYKGD